MNERIERADRFIAQWLERNVPGDRFLDVDDPLAQELIERLEWSATRAGFTKADLEASGAPLQRLVEANNRKTMTTGLGHISEDS